MKSVLQIFFLAGYFTVCLPPVVWSFPFQGEIDLDQKQAVVAVYPQGDKPWVFTVQQDQARMFSVSADIQNFQTALFDITTFLESRWKFSTRPDDGRKRLTGTLGSRYTLMDHLPVEELTGQFEITHGVLYLNSLNVGKLKCQGKVQLALPHKLTLDLQFKDMDFDRFLLDESVLGPGISLGKVDGTIAVSGEPGQIMLRGKLITYPDQSQESNYQQAQINFSGVYPQVEIHDSTATNEDGMTSNLSGKLDLSDRKNLPKQIDALSKEPLLRKKGNDLEWTLKRLQSPNRSGSVEVKYLMRKNSDADPGARDRGDLLGVEQKIQF